MPKVSSVEEYISRHAEWEELLLTFRKLLLETELKETIKWGAPTYTLDNKNVVGFSAFSEHAGLWFFQGVFLDDPDGLLINAQKGKTRALRQLRFEKGKPVNEKVVRDFVRQAIENQKAGKEIKPKRNKKLVIPPELQVKLSADPKLKEHFQELTDFKQREYAEYIIEAKRSDTKQRRIKKIIPMIEKGIGLNDKYR